MLNRPEHRERAADHERDGDQGMRDGDEHERAPKIHRFVEGEDEREAERDRRGTEREHESAVEVPPESAAGVHDCSDRQQTDGNGDERCEDGESKGVGDRFERRDEEGAARRIRPQARVVRQAETVPGTERSDGEDRQRGAKQQRGEGQCSGNQPAVARGPRCPQKLSGGSQ